MKFNKFKKSSHRFLFSDFVEKTHEIPEGLLTTSHQVLIVEDDLALADVLTQALEADGCKVSRAIDGKEGVRRILAADYDIILCDMVMPGFPGDMFYRAVERVRPHLCSRFLFMTGHRADASIDAFVRSVRGLLLWKPFQAHELYAAIRAVLQRAEAKGATHSSPAAVRI